MITAALFPFQRGLLPIVRHFHELQDQYQLTELISMPGTGVTGKDAAFVCNQPNLGITVTDRLEPEKLNWEVLLVVREQLPIEYDLNSTVRGVLSFGKKIFFLEHSYETVPEWLKEMNHCEENLDIFCNEDLWKQDGKINGYEKISTPVILTGGIVEEADVFETTIVTASVLKDMGLRVAVITKDAAAQLFGFLDFTNLYSKYENAAEKVSALNIAIRAVERNLVPDIIVIEAPDAMIRYNDIAPNGFGLYTYMLCQAVAVDFLICSMPYDLAQEGFIKLLSEDFKIRYGTEISIVHASNVLIDSIELLNQKHLSYFYDNFSRVIDFIESLAGESEIPMLNVIVQRDSVTEYMNKLLFKS